MLLTLAERKTRFEVIMKLDGKDAQAVDQAIMRLRMRAGREFGNLFKTITSDNGSEFSGLHEALQNVVDVYFSHPYTSWERGTSENNGGFLFTTASPCDLCAKKAYQLGVKKIYYIDPYPGISQSHILKFGNKSNPEMQLFYGAIGKAYISLYTQRISYKDE